MSPVDLDLLIIVLDVAVVVLLPPVTGPVTRRARPRWHRGRLLLGAGLSLLLDVVAVTTVVLLGAPPMPGARYPRARWR